MKNSGILRILAESDNENDKDKVKCDLFSAFSALVQIILAVICILILICKKYNKN